MNWKLTIGPYVWEVEPGSTIKITSDNKAIVESGKIVCVGGPKGIGVTVETLPPGGLDHTRISVDLSREACK